MDSVYSSCYFSSFGSDSSLNFEWLDTTIEMQRKTDPKTHRVWREMLDRSFVAWDGEGITYESSKQQAYVLLAASTGDYILAGEGKGLDTKACFDLLFRVEAGNRDACHIGFGFGYDTNQILNSLSRREIYGLSYQIKRGKTYHWRREGQPEYRIKVHPGKLFRVAKGSFGSDDYGCVTIYDTFGFFQRSFIEVVKAYCPENLHRIQHGKDNRRSFQYRDIEEITRYCLAENEILVEILEKLRGYFEDSGLSISQWYGPGAIANADFKKHSIKKYMGFTPPEVGEASRIAYQSGRFELLRAGYYSNTVWHYDINSAHPSAIVTLPQLSEGHWEFTKTFEPGSFAVWHCRYRNRNNARQDRYFDYRAEPLFFRDRHGRIAYPYNVDGWYWTPEAELLLEIKWPADIEIEGGWIWRPSNNYKPFSYIQELYDRRLELKAQHDGAEVAYKLRMNSAYGKTAQRSGWFQEGDRIPPYHQLEWAGFITSSTRAKLFRAYNLRPGAVLAFETDAIFSIAPIRELEISDKLGEWSVKKYSDLLYVQSGFYFAHSAANNMGVLLQGSAPNSAPNIAHYRGFDKGSITFEMVMEWLDRLNPDPFHKNEEKDKLYGSTKRFVGFKRALTSQNRHIWRTWDEKPREITIGREGKRIHMPACPACRHGKKWTEEMHALSITHTMHPYGVSYPHKIPWISEDYGNIWDDEDQLTSLDGYE